MGSSQEVCDGEDDDCDGSTDEDYLALATSCGVGACGAVGSRACVAGAVVDTCDPNAGLVCDEGLCRTRCELAADQPSNVGCEFWAVDLDQFDLVNDPASMTWGVALSNASDVDAEVYRPPTIPLRTFPSIVVATGSSPAEIVLGEQLTGHLAAEGHTVYATVRREPDADRLAEIETVHARRRCDHPRQG